MEKPEEMEILKCMICRIEIMPNNIAITACNYIPEDIPQLPRKFAVCKKCVLSLGIMLMQGNLTAVFKIFKGKL